MALQRLGRQSYVAKRKCTTLRYTVSLTFLLEDDCCRRLGVECKADHFYFHRLEFSTLDLSELNFNNYKSDRSGDVGPGRC